MEILNISQLAFVSGGDSWGATPEGQAVVDSGSIMSNGNDIYTDGDHSVDGDHGSSNEITLPTVTITYNATAAAEFTAKMVDDCTTGNLVVCAIDLFNALGNAYNAAPRP